MERKKKERRGEVCGDVGLKNILVRVGSGDRWGGARWDWSVPGTQFPHWGPSPHPIPPFLLQVQRRTMWNFLGLGSRMKGGGAPGGEREQ